MARAGSAAIASRLGANSTNENGTPTRDQRGEVPAPDSTHEERSEMDKIVPPEPADRSFVVWYDSNDEPYAVYFRSDDSSEGTAERWFSADQHNGTGADPQSWADLVNEMVTPPYLLKDGGPVA